MGRKCFGYDVGTYTLVCAERNDKNEIICRHEVNAFIELMLKGNDFVFNMMKQTGVPLILREDSTSAYALGEAAVEMAYTMPTIELKRPMKDGCVNPKEVNAFQIMKIMMHSLLEDVKDEKALLYYTVPANAINVETDADYHNKILEAIFKAYKSETGKTVEARPINEALALAYAELGAKQYTGLAISCLCPGTKIYTKYGIKNIEDVKIGDLVLTHKGRWKPVTNVITKQFNGKATKLQIQGYTNTTEDYKFVDNHELYTLTEDGWKWKGCEELKEGMIVGEPIINQDRFAKNNYIYFSEKTTCSIKSTKKVIKVTNDLIRLIGYFMGDGSVNMSEGCFQFDFHKKELNYINDVKNIIKNCFNKNISETKHGDNCTRIKCYSKGLAKWFKEKCYKNESKTLPWCLSTFTKSNIINLITGMVRSDGWSLNDNNISFGNSNTELVFIAKQCFAKLGIATSLTYRKPRLSNINGRVIQGKKLEWSINTGAKTSLISLFDLIERTNCDNSTFSEKLFIDNGFSCSKIQKVEQENYSGIVYDLQVEEDHSFSGPQLTIHNCGAGMVNVCFAMFGAPVFSFAIANSGDWIDQMAAKATNEAVAYINKEKKSVDLMAEPKTLVERAIQTQYRLMLEKTMTGLKKGFTDNAAKVRLDTPIDIVIAGGTSMPKGFDIMFKEVLSSAQLPIKVGSIIRPAEPLFSVAKGALIAAENA